MPSKISFEESLAQLEEIVGILERNDTPLEKAIALFEDGIAISNQCTKKIEQAENKVKALVQTEAGFVLKEFDEDS